MFTRFKMNVRTYPRTFSVVLVGCALAVVESFIPRLVGIDARHLASANLVDLVLSFMLAALIYRSVFNNSGRMRIALDMINRFEGHDVCTMSEHTIDDSDEDYTEDDDSIIEEPEEEDDEEF